MNVADESLKIIRALDEHLEKAKEAYDEKDYRKLFKSVDRLKKDVARFALLQGEQNEDLCFAAVNVNPEFIRYVKDQKQDLCVLAVKKDPRSLKYVKEQNEEICRIAVENALNA